MFFLQDVTETLQRLLRELAFAAGAPGARCPPGARSFFRRVAITLDVIWREAL